MPPRNAFFTGREEPLTWLHRALQGNGAAAVVQAIAGLGGMGKTALAVEYAYRYGEGYAHIFFVSAATVGELRAGYRAIAGSVLPEIGADADDAVVVQKVREYLNATPGYLLILDNADFGTDLSTSDLEAFLPPAAKGHILITSRRQTFPGNLHVRQENVLHLNTLPPNEAHAFLTERCYGKDATPSGDEAKAIRELAQELGYLPLALEQAAAYVAANEGTYRNYLPRYRKRSLELLEEQKPEAGNYPKSVRTTWDISFKEVEKECTAAVELLHLCAYLAPDHIPNEVVIAAANGTLPTVSAFFGSLDDEDENEAHYHALLAPLTRYSLVTKDTERNAFSLHRLVQIVLQSAQTPEEHQETIAQAAEVLNWAFPPGDFENWPTCERLVLHAQTVATQALSLPLRTESTALLCNSTAYYLKARGRYAEALPLSLEALEIRRSSLPVGHPDIAISLNNLAGLYKTLGRFSDALLLSLEALEIHHSSFPVGHRAIAMSLNNLAGLYSSLGRYEDALPLSLEALEIYRQSFPVGHPYIAISLNNLAGLYKTLGRFSDALLLSLEALEIDRASLPVGHPDIANSLNNLALLYKTLGRTSEALPLYLEALEIRRASLPVGHSDIANSLNNLAGLYQALGRTSEALPLYLEALEILEKSLGKEHPNTKVVAGNLQILQEEIQG